MDYGKIGQRIRFWRKARGLSQEALAERVNISTTHMSHIETGNTKLSLPVLVELAAVLQVRTDELLSDTASSAAAIEEIACVLEQCSEGEARVITEIVKAAKRSMEQYM